MGEDPVRIPLAIYNGRCLDDGSAPVAIDLALLVHLEWLTVHVSLVVAQIHDGGVSLVADTKISFRHDETLTRQSYRNALPKVLVLRDDLAIGITGNIDEHLLERLVRLRDSSVSDLLAAAERIAAAGFVVAALGPRQQLWHVHDGEREDASSRLRCWEGDVRAYDLFQQRYHEWPDSMDSAFRLLSSMQWLCSFNRVPSVGGFVTRIATTSDGFRYAADPMTVGPWFLDALAEATTDGVNITFQAPAGGDAQGFQVLPVVGRPPTIGALAYLLPEAHTAWLFPHETPWVRTAIRATSPEELIQSAKTLYGQSLTTDADG